MFVNEVMTRGVLTVGSDSTLEELKSFLLEHGVSGAPVVDPNGKLVGVVSATDLLRSGETAEARPSDPSSFFASTLNRPLSHDESRSMHLVNRESQFVSDVMTPVVFQVDEDTLVEEVADMMTRGRIHRVVVTRRGVVTGIVSTLDLVRVLRDLLRKERLSIAESSATPLDV